MSRFKLPSFLPAIKHKAYGVAPTLAPHVNEVARTATHLGAPGLIGETAFQSGLLLKDLLAKHVDKQKVLDVGKEYLGYLLPKVKLGEVKNAAIIPAIKSLAITGSTAALPRVNQLSQAAMLGGAPGLMSEGVSQGIGAVGSTLSRQAIKRRVHSGLASSKSLSRPNDPLLKIHDKSLLGRAGRAFSFLSPMSKIGNTLKKQAEEAPGIPDRGMMRTIPKITEPKEWEYAIQEHFADRRGKHYDLRIIDPKSGVAYSWALVGDKLPGPSQFVHAVRQSDHTAEYSRQEHDIPKGTYGAGKVNLLTNDRIEVLYSSPEHISFNVYKGNQIEEFALHHIGEKMWKLHNKTLTRKKLDLPEGKPKFKSLAPTDIDFSNKDQIMSGKVDGASNLILLPDAGKPIKVISYRPSVRSTGIIDHTFRIPVIRDRVRVPKGLEDTILRAEVFAFNTDTRKALRATDTGGILNSGVWRSLEKQKEMNAPLKVMLYDVVRFKGQNVENAPYEKKLEMMRQVAQKVPARFELPRIARTTEEKKRLWDDIQNNRFEYSREGVVLWEDGKATKAKLRDDYDVVIKGVTEGEGRLAGKGIGGFHFAHYDAPDKIVGIVGTGLSDALRADAFKHPEDYHGLVVKVKAHDLYHTDDGKPGALMVPVLIGPHVDKNLPEKLEKLYDRKIF